MDFWPYPIKYTPWHQIDEFCRKDKEWQKFRLAMKGKPTTVKLQMLESWRNIHIIDNRELNGKDELPIRTQVQIDNYLNALKRGGQLDANCKVQR